MNLVETYKGYDIEETQKMSGECEFRVKGFDLLVFKTLIDARKCIVQRNTSPHICIDELKYEKLSRHQFYKNCKYYYTPFQSNMKSRIVREQAKDKHLVQII